MANQRNNAPPAQPAHWRDLHPRTHNPTFLFAEDLGPVGTRVDVEIINSGDAEVQGEDGKKPMPFLEFRGSDGKPRRKRLGVSASNCKILETIFDTPDYLRWRGWITLVVVRGEYNDRKLRERLKANKIQVALRQPDPPRRPPAKRDAKPENMPPAQPPAGETGAPAPTADEQAEIAKLESEGTR